MASDESAPACIQHMGVEGFERATGESDIALRKTCTLCFGDGFSPDEFDPDELVILRSSSAQAFHRPLSTGLVGSEAHQHPEMYGNLAKQLQDPDVTDVDDVDFERAFGGPGGEA